jgi:repressor LexA
MRVEVEKMGNGHITDKQTEILKYIEEQIIRKGYPPSVREICEAVRLSSTSSVHAHLNSLEKNGYIRRNGSNSRSIEILDESFQMARTETVAIPIVGRIAAGEPILASQNIETYFSVPAEYMPATSNDVFGLEVQGDSMINAGILNKDLLIVEQQNTARNGEIVVALLGDSATVKTFYKENGHYRLQPENDTMDPILIYGDLKILGKVIGVIRFFR